MNGLIFYSFLHSENSQWAIPCYSKTDLALRCLSQEKKRCLQSCQNWAWPMKSVHLVAMRERCGQNLIVSY